MKLYKFIIIFALFFVFGLANASVQDEIAERSRQIEELQRQIDEYQVQVDSSRTKSMTLENEIARLNAEINQVQLEIRSLNLSINQTTAEIGETERQINDAEAEMGKHKNALAQYIKLAYENDQRSLTEVLLDNDSLSDFFNELNNISATQDNLQITIKSIKALRLQLEGHQVQLEDKQTELERTKRLQELEKSSLDSTKFGQNKLLKDTKGQESKYQELVKKSQQDIEALRAQITYLMQNGVTAEEAVKFAQLAAIRTGIRPAFLLAELEQESALGSNVGKCYIIDATSGSTRSVITGKVFAKGIHPTRDLPLFLIITSELSMDPFQTPISCGYGWGGAMGPAQFIPSTWMGYREEVSRLTGHSLPSPWNIEDAFIAAAAKLSRDGADSQTRAGEIAASKRYYCGSATSKSSGCINYANSVQRLAAEIAKNL
ncbi:MAG: lytic murein transglycosylase [Pseudomonadota bacterium]